MAFKMILEEEQNRIKYTRFWAITIFVFSLILFILSLLFDVQSKDLVSSILGIINCVIVWVYLVFL